MMNTYNDLMMLNTNGPPLQQDYHQYPNNPNSLDLSYNSDLFMSSTGNMGQQPVPNRHMNVMPQHQQPPHPQAAMHQVILSVDFSSTPAGFPEFYSYLSSTNEISLR